MRQGAFGHPQPHIAQRHEAHEAEIVARRGGGLARVADAALAEPGGDVLKRLEAAPEGAEIGGERRIPGVGVEIGGDLVEEGAEEAAVASG